METSCLQLPEVDPSTCLHETLLRFTDDFLFCSSSIERARSFAHAMLIRFPEYGSTINPSKTLVNFPFRNPCTGEFLPQKSIGIPWCGFLIDDKTLETKLDFDRYFTPDTPLRRCKKAVRSLSSISLKFFFTVRHYSGGILFDSRVNSTETIKLNLSHIFRLAVRRYKCMIESSRIQLPPVIFMKKILALGRDCVKHRLTPSVLRKNQVSMLLKRIIHNSPNSGTRYPI